jgi:hypothetical protein
MKIIHKYGKHSATLQSVFTTYKNVIKNYKKMYVTFTPDSIYFTKNSKNQNSWSKILGRKSLRFSFQGNFRIMHNSDLIAWRYLIEKDCFQIAFYQRVKGRFRYKIIKDNIKANTTVEINVKDYINKRSLPLPSGPYFGGQEPAPHDLSYYLTFQ